MDGIRRMARIAVLAATAAALASCGGGGDAAGGSPSASAPTTPAPAPTPTPSPPPAPAPAPAPAPPPAAAVTIDESFRFLNQATFGATSADATRVMALGDSSTAYGRWIDAELAKPASTLLPAVEAAYPVPLPAGYNLSLLNPPRIEQWFANVLRGDDQLRQRVAWALSQIFVVSQVGALQNVPSATADFYDLLARDAFGDYRTLIQDVTLHPAMGVYLSMLGNQKAQAGTNLRPDENYARELMQLMSIGLVELNPDGTQRTGTNGQPIPTYDQSVVEGFARVFTGWKWACPTTTPSCTFANTRQQREFVAGYNPVRPMQLFADQHETGTKLVLGGTTIPAGQSGTQDLRDALDNIARHANVGPFLGRQLIQKLVTSNPSPAYVGRVSAVFADDGTGRRGNLGAVVKAILLDPEARTAPSDARAGKLKEPLLRLTQYWRAYGAKAASGRYGVARNFSGGVNAVFGEGPGLSPSVFNFYSPTYAPPGEIANQGYVAPETQLANEYLNTQSTNYFWTQATARTTTQSASLNVDDMFSDTREEIALVANSDALVARVAEKLLGSAAAMSPDLRAQTKAQVDRTTIPATSPATAINTRVGDAIFFIVTSPEYAVQK